VWKRSKRLELPVHEDRHVVRAGERVDLLHLRRVALHAEFLFGNHDGGALQVAPDLRGRILEIGHVVRAEPECAAMALHEPIARVVPQGLRLQAVRQSAMRRRAVRGTSSRQQNRRRRADRALVCEQDVVGTAAVAEMLVDIYNRLA
jgi:hypothetical protein